MGVPGKFRQLEKERNKPIAEILVDELNKHDGNISDIARELGMSYAKVYNKIKAIDPIKTPARWSLPEAEHADAL